MSIIRVKKRAGFTVMSNHHLQNRGLSLKAKGLLSLLLSQPDEWKISVEGLADFSVDGKAAIATAIGELIRAGYISRTQVHGENGVFAGYDYVVTETPGSAPFSENREMAPPFTDFPSMENRQMVLYSSNTNTPIAPKGAEGAKSKKEPKKAPDWKPEQFNKFWAIYPLGKKKQAAIAAWDKLKPDDALLEKMAIGLKRDLASVMWKRGIGIPYASTWLNQRRWEDEDHRLLPAAGEPDDEEREELAEW